MSDQGKKDDRKAKLDIEAGTDADNTGRGKQDVDGHHDFSDDERCIHSVSKINRLAMMNLVWRIVFTAFVSSCFTLTEEMFQYGRNSAHGTESLESLKGCRSGWYGPFCDKKCSRMCRYSTCDQTDGACTLGCKSTWMRHRYNPICEGNIKRKVKRSQNSNHCLKNDTGSVTKCLCCKDGYRGDHCEVVCPNCRTYHADTLCEYMCEGGYYGPTCNTTCPKNCALGKSGKTICISNNATQVKCTGCKRGFYGHQCNIPCSKYCLREVCYIDNGTCVDCMRSFYGNECSSRCSSTCLDGRCHRNRGTCIHTCPAHCAPKGYAPSCKNESSGIQCSFGCQDGYYGPTCDSQCLENCKRCNQSSVCEVCDDTRYGENCDQICSADCSSRLCYRNGTCKEVCPEGRYGSNCNMTCSPHCLYSTCHTDSAHHNQSYRCTSGCVDGYTGYQCDEVVLHEGKSVSQDSSVAVAVALSVTFVLIAVIAVIICKLKKVWSFARCPHMFGRRYNIRRFSGREGHTAEHELEHLKAHRGDTASCDSARDRSIVQEQGYSLVRAEDETSCTLERVNSFRRYQQYWRLKQKQLKESKNNSLSDNPSPLSTCDVPSYGSWPGRANNNGLDIFQDDGTVIPQKGGSKKTGPAHIAGSCSKLDESRCTDFNQTWFKWKDANEDRRKHKEKMDEVTKQLKETYHQ